MNDETKRRLMKLWLLRMILKAFMFYFVLITVLLVLSIFWPVLTDVLELALYIGSVAGVGFAIYIIKENFKKRLKLLLLGCFCFLVNALNIITYLI